MRSSRCRLGILWSVILLGSVAGCSKPAPTLAPSQQEAMDRVDAIVQKSGGDWNKLTPDDQKYFIEVRGRGREDLARTLLAGLAKRAGAGVPSRPLSAGAHK